MESRCRRAAFNVDNAKHGDVEDDDGVVHSYDSIISNILAPGGTYMDVSLADNWLCHQAL
ncbi:MAG: hypothetical protein ACLTDV_01685 [Eubacterium sp.]